MSERKPYVRPQHPYWWARRPYRSYTLRELSGVAVALYAGVLLVGLFSLSRGAQAYSDFLRWLTSSGSVVLHIVLLAAMLLHAVTWFQTLPKTMPRLVIDGKVVPSKRLTLSAMTVAAFCSATLVIGFLL